MMFLCRDLIYLFFGCTSADNIKFCCFSWLPGVRGDSAVDQSSSHRQRWKAELRSSEGPDKLGRFQRKAAVWINTSPSHSGGLERFICSGQDYLYVFVWVLEWRLWKRMLYQILKTTCSSNTTSYDRLPPSACATSSHVKRCEWTTVSKRIEQMRPSSVSVGFKTVCFRSKNAFCKMEMIGWSCWCCFVVRTMKAFRPPQQELWLCSQLSRRSCAPNLPQWYVDAALEVSEYDRYVKRYI